MGPEDPPVDLGAGWTPLRRAERLQGAGAVLLIGHPSLEAQLRPEWLAELARRTAREVRWEARPALAIEAPHAQLVER